QYPIFGHPQVMPVKVLWDYAFYWALLAPLFFSRRQADLPMLSRLKPAFVEGRDLNLAMQRLMREWGTRDRSPELRQARAYDQFQVDWCYEMNRALTDELDDAAYIARTQRGVAAMRQLAAEVLAMAREAVPGIGDHGLDALLAGHDIHAHPSMLPVQWFAPVGEPVAAA